MQFGDGPGKSSLVDSGQAEVRPGNRENRKLGKNRDNSLRICIRGFAVSGFPDKFDFLSMIALGVASAIACTAMLIAPRVPPVMPQMASRARLHVARKAGANSAD
jgi:hypothetical protein